MEAAAREKPTATLVVPFAPDAAARGGGGASQRRLAAGAFDPATADVKLREWAPFVSTDPRTGLPVAPQRSGAELVVSKFHLANGVLQTVRAVFQLDDEAGAVSPHKLEATIEMCLPKEDKDGKDFDVA